MTMHQPRRLGRFVCWTAVACLSWSGVSCLSLEAGPAPPPQESKESSALRVSITARDMEIGDMLSSFAQQIEARLELDPDITGKISLELKEAKLEDAMKDLCILFECEWSLSAGKEPALIVRRATK